MNSLKVEIAFAQQHRQTIVALELAPGATILDAITQSGILAAHPDIDLQHASVGVWGRPARLDDQLRDGARVEIYRALQADPKVTRRRRARQMKIPT